MNYELGLHLIGLILGAFLLGRIIVGKKFGWVDVVGFTVAAVLYVIQYRFFE